MVVKSCLEHCMSYLRNAVTFFLVLTVRPNHSNVASSDKYRVRFCLSLSIICLYHCIKVLACCRSENLFLVLLLFSCTVIVLKFLDFRFCGEAGDLDIFLF